jgi:hypothetical protein
VGSSFTDVALTGADVSDVQFGTTSTFTGAYGTGITGYPASEPATLELSGGTLTVLATSTSSGSTSGGSGPGGSGPGSPGSPGGSGGSGGGG